MHIVLPRKGEANQSWSFMDSLTVNVKREGKGNIPKKSLNTKDSHPLCRFEGYISVALLEGSFN